MTASVLQEGWGRQSSSCALSEAVAPLTGSTTAVRPGGGSRFMTALQVPEQFIMRAMREPEPGVALARPGRGVNIPVLSSRCIAIKCCLPRRAAQLGNRQGKAARLSPAADYSVEEPSLVLC